MKFRNTIKENNSFCTGCSACCMICPTGAINLKQDYYGYWRTSFDETKCVNCGKCDDICPIQKYPPITRNHQARVYAVQMKDYIREKCSSGGAFFSVAKKILDCDGVVVGCKWNEKNIAIHDIIFDHCNIEKLCGSKYVQSYMGDIYKRTYSEIKKGKKVLFSGTPCQVAGLYSFLGKDYSNLYTIDILCYYTPSPLMLKNYLEEEYDNEQIKSIAFRDKKNGWTCEKMSITSQNEEGIEKHYVCENGHDVFQTAFHNRIMMSEHCENCVFATLPRLGDVTIGDLWHVEKWNPEFDDGKGTNAIIVNSDKGKRVFEAIGEDAIRSTEISIDCLRGNRIDKTSLISRSNENKRFFQLYKTKKFVVSAKYAYEHFYDVAIVGCWDVKNYGSHLTYYALKKLIESMGYSALMVGCPKNAKYKSTGNAILFMINPYNEWDIAQQYEDIVDMTLINYNVNAFVLGSDQLWNNSLYKYFGKFSLLEFAFENKKKIAFSTSFGDDKWEGESYEKDLFKYYLKRFDAISVRETSGVNVCEKYFGINATWCLDPIFLCDKKEYDNLSEKSNLSLPKHYLAAYILDYKKEIENLIVSVSEKLRIEYVVVTDPNLKKQKWSIEAHMNYYEEDWIKLIKNCDYLLTDSFHGTCMALIYNKEFSVIVNQSRGAARFIDYADKFCFQERLLENPVGIKNFSLQNERLNYDLINKKIEQYRNESIIWLKSNLAKIEDAYELSETDIEKIKKYIIKKNDMSLKKYLKKIHEIGYVNAVKKIAKKILHKYLNADIVKK